MIGSSTTGSVNDGLAVSTTFDAAGNRTNYTVVGAVPPDTAYLTITGGSVVEGGNLAFVITRSGFTGNSVTITYTSASGAATSGTDFTAVSDTATFAPGETVKTVMMVTADDTAAEAAEGLSVTLSNAVASGAPAIIVPASYEASSSWQSYTGLSGNGAGMRDTVFNQLSTVHGTLGVQGSWVKMDLGSVKAVGNVVLAPIAQSYGGWGPYYLNGATLERSNDGTGWTPVQVIAGAVDGQWTEYPVNAGARYLRVRHTTGDWLGIGDFAARDLGTAGGVTINIASATGTIIDNDTATGPVTIIPQSYTASSNYNSYTGLSGTGAGMRDTIYTGTANVHGTQGIVGSWVEMDLGSNQAVGKVVLAPITAPWGGWSAAYLNGVALEYSSDHSNWTTAQIITNAADGQATEYPINVTTRYIRVHRQTGSWIGIGEFFAQTP